MQHVYVKLRTPENNYGRIQKSDELPILAARRARLAVLFYRYEGIAESSELPAFTIIMYLIEKPMKNRVSLARA